METHNADADGIPHYPEWRITFTEYTPGGIIRNTVSVEIDTAGRVAAVLFGTRSDIPDEELDEAAYIPEETAVSLALAQLRAEGYDVDLEHFTVEAILSENKGSVNWVLTFLEIENADGGYALAWQQAYWVVLDASTGECLRTSVGR